MEKEIEVVFDAHTNSNSMEYVPDCDGGGINLHIYDITFYSHCKSCEHLEDCEKDLEWLLTYKFPVS